MLKCQEINLGNFAVLLTIMGFIMNLMWKLAQELFKIAEIVGISDASISIDTEKEEAFSQMSIVKGKSSLPIVYIKNLTFSFDKKKIFENFDLEIATGEKIAIVGRSGTGKSTLANLIINFYQNYSGEVWVCGKRVNMCTQERILKYISIMPQESSLFSCSVLENLCYGNSEVGEYYLHDICKDLDIQNYIKGDSNLKIEELCGGDRQKICLVRTLLKESKIVILDEPFSQLDEENTKKSWDVIDKHLEGRTLIVLCHKEPECSNIDRVVYL